MNKYLLERYPTIWNTHIVWVLPLALLAQVLFFIGGFFFFNIIFFTHRYIPNLLP